MKTYEKIFDILSQADDYVNGEKIAQELGVSRTSIWKAIQKLEKEGIQIESVKNRGYRLTAGDLLIPDWIEEHSPVQVSFNPDCLSTQMDAKAGMEAGRPADTLYLAAAQSAGRGQPGRLLHVSPPQAQPPLRPAPLLYNLDRRSYLQGSKKSNPYRG